MTKKMIKFEGYLNNAIFEKIINGDDYVVRITIEIGASETYYHMSKNDIVLLLNFLKELEK